MSIESTRFAAGRTHLPWNGIIAAFAGTLAAVPACADDLHIPPGVVQSTSCVIGVSELGSPRTPQELGPSSYSLTLDRDWLPSDRLQIEVHDSVDLNSGSSRRFICNAAGVILGTDPTNTGNHPGEIALGTSGIPRYGALAIGNASLGYFLLLPANADNGLGSSTPPVDLARCVPLSEIFTSPGFIGLPAGTTLQLRVVDTPREDNIGSFRVGQARSGIVIRTPPRPWFGCPTATAMFSVVVGGTPAHAWRWQMMDDAGAWIDLNDGPLVLSGELLCATVSASREPAVQIALACTVGGPRLSGRQVRCVISNECGSTATEPVGLSLCPADVDDGNGLGQCDGGITIDDLLYYLVLFSLGTIPADLDDGTSTGTPDGGVTVDDLLYYLQRFEAGC